MHVQVCVHAGMSVSVSVTVYRCEGGCVLADMDTSAFNGVVSQPPSNVEALGKKCRGTHRMVCIWVRVCMDEGDCIFFFRVTVCMCKCACVQV